MAASSMTRWVLHGSGAFGKCLLPIRPAQWCNPMKKWVLLSHPHKGSTWAQVPEILIHWFVLKQSTPWLLSVLRAGCCGSQGRSGRRSGRPRHGDQRACCCPHQRQHMPNTNSGWMLLQDETIRDDVLSLGVVIIYKAGFCVYSTCAPLCHKVNLKTSSRLHNVKFTSPLLTQNHPQFSWRIKWHRISRRGGNGGHGGSAGF